MSGAGEREARIKALERENALLRQGLDQAHRLRRLWNDALDELQQAKTELEEANAHLSTLYRVASTLTRTLDTDALYEEILDAMSEAVGLGGRCACGIFQVDGDHMLLAAQRGGSEAFVEAHEGMPVGECLCGAAAREGEILISHACPKDMRHTITYPSAAPHSHVIIPLKAKGHVVGVFYYYLPPEMHFEEHHLETFEAVGALLGMAIENARLYEETKQLSARDPLTGLANRRQMERALEHLLDGTDHHCGDLAVVILDIDHFKRFNDTHGHPEGDRVLVAVAEVLQRHSRDGDIATRYGGEEFLVILPKTGLEQAVEAAERFRAAIEKHTPVTASLGVASMGTGMPDIHELVQRADRALYRSKQAGRNRVKRAE